MEQKFNCNFFLFSYHFLFLSVLALQPTTPQPPPLPSAFRHLNLFGAYFSFLKRFLLCPSYRLFTYGTTSYVVDLSVKNQVLFNYIYRYRFIYICNINLSLSLSVSFYLSLFIFYFVLRLLLLFPHHFSSIGENSIVIGRSTICVQT